MDPAERRFEHTEVAGGAVLLATTVAALVWANSPWRASYVRLFDDGVRHIVNDWLMALFFFV
ncbi:MAG TPA: Na+/H+ antiporter NhaA, partial [Acidimicrobiales bacterium]|nr:Na+/H+ antiporter NhaA [Acidimicrobiales bacterium]